MFMVNVCGQFLCYIQNTFIHRSHPLSLVLTIYFILFLLFFHIYALKFDLLLFKAKEMVYSLFFNLVKYNMTFLWFKFCHQKSIIKYKAMKINFDFSS